MKQVIVFTSFVLLLSGAAGALYAKEPRPASEDNKKETQKDLSKISEAFGHLMAKNIDAMGVKFDLQSVIKGLKNAAAGKTSPMSELECIEAITAAQETAFKEQSSHNLVAAEKFLAQNSQVQGIVSLEEGKIQYKIDKEGSGSALQTDSTPLIRYSGKFLNGEVFGSSQEDELLSLEEIISGLKTGMIGMKEGEKRTIFIHPELAYGTKGSLPPNSLLTFEIEVVKANGSFIEEGSLDLPSEAQPFHSEIAIPDPSMTEHVR